MMEQRVEGSVESKQWLVLRCGSSRTMALVNHLNDEHVTVECLRKPRGAWTPLIVENRRVPGTKDIRPRTRPWLPSFVFIPEASSYDLPIVPGIPFGIMMIEGVRVRIADHELAHLRRIDDTPRMKGVKLPAPGQRMRLTGAGMEGLRCKVVHCKDASRCLVKVEDGKPPFFHKPFTVPASILVSDSL